MSIKSLPPALRNLLAAPTFAARRSKHDPTIVLRGRRATPAPPPPEPELDALFGRIAEQSTARGVGWGEWLSFTVCTGVFSTLTNRRLRCLRLIRPVRFSRCIGLLPGSTADTARCVT